MEPVDHDGPRRAMERLAQAINERDIEQFVALFSPAYVSEQPGHPDRAFGGAEQVRENWTALFASMPDTSAELLDISVTGDTAWTEWVWRGGALETRGVTLFTVHDGLIVHGRLYMEPDEREGAGIRAAVADLTQRASGTSG
jgi:ketosteroid isomerase-like protein